MAALAAACVLSTGAAVASDQRLLLDVVINGHPVGKIGEFIDRDGALFARRDELNDVGLKVPDTAPRTAEGLVPLSALPGVTTHLDMAAQTLSIQAASEQLIATMLRSEPDSASVQVESGTGATLNYDVTEDFASGHSVTSGLFDGRIFSPYGVLSSSALAFAGATPLPGHGDYAVVRLDSAYTYSDVDNLRRYTLGD
ncbi:MAG TPA: hypothetical protein VGG69_10160, partial [Rhizomicrobium sp.]